MKARPVLFSAQMVRALLDGSKTQTRRIVKFGKLTPLTSWIQSGVRRWGWCDKVGHGEDVDDKNFLRICPYGKPGEKLWVRETWRIGAWDENEGQVAVDYMAGPVATSPWIDVPDDGTRSIETFEHYWIQSTDDAMKAGLLTDADDKYHWEPGQSPCRIRPAIFMPRWASRITLEITSVRVEKLQDITHADAMAEGISGDELNGAQGYAPKAYRRLWESINGTGSWDENPWVWVIEFRRVTP